MGISTYCILPCGPSFRSDWTQSEVIDKYFTKTPSRVEGIGLDAIAEEALSRHQSAFAERVDGRATNLDTGGVYQWRANGEKHLFNPTTIHKLQKATDLEIMRIFRNIQTLSMINLVTFFTLRGLMEFAGDPSESVPLDEVEPASEIVNAFKTGLCHMVQFPRSSSRKSCDCYESTWW